MITIYLSGKTVIATSKSAKDARAKWKNIEQIDSVADETNVYNKIERARKQYKANDVVIDFKVKIARIITQQSRQKMSDAASNRTWSDDVKQRIANSMKGKRNHRINHSPDAKMMISDSMRGNNNAAGLLWCYDPVTLEQKRVKDIPYGMVTGRPPKSISRLA